MIDEVAAHSGMDASGHGDFEFGADTVGAGNENWLFPFLLVEREERAESTDAAENTGGEGMAGMMANALLGGVGYGYVYSCVGVFHGSPVSVSRRGARDHSMMRTG